MLQSAPVSPPRVVIRCAKRCEHTIGPAERIVNVSSRKCENTVIDMLLDTSTVRRAPPQDWLDPLWEAMYQIMLWAKTSGSIVILCDTGVGTSRLMASMLGSILQNCGANVTRCPPPEPNKGWLAEMYLISQTCSSIDDMEEKLSWILNKYGEPTDAELEMHGADH